MMDKVSVLLVDDHAVVRAGYKAYLSLAEHIGDIYEAESGEKACQLYTDYQPNIVILDMSMPGIGGLETIRRLIMRDANCDILVFSIYDEAVFVERAMKAGAKGYLLKSSSPETLIAAVNKIIHGGQFISPEVIGLSANIKIEGESALLKKLSAREFDVFCLLAQGQTGKAIADELCLSYKTVANYSTTIKEKLALKSVAEMTLIATRQGIIKVI